VGEPLPNRRRSTETPFADSVGSYNASRTTRRSPHRGRMPFQPPAVTETAFADSVGSYTVRQTTRRSPPRGRMVFPNEVGL